MTKKIFLTLILASVMFMSFSLISAADTSGKIQINTGGGVIGGCDEQWSCFCDEDTGKYVCYQYNPLCDTENLRPAIDGTSCVAPPGDNGGPIPSGGGGGGGSGGGGGGSGITTLSITQEGDNECVENWECEAWSNTEEQCGTRFCTDANSCGTTELKPLTFKACSSSDSSGFGSGITWFATAVGNLAKSPVAIIIFILIVVGLAVLIKIARRG